MNINVVLMWDGQYTTLGMVGWEQNIYQMVKHITACIFVFNDNFNLHSISWLPLPLPLPYALPTIAFPCAPSTHGWGQANASLNAGQSILGLWLWLTLKLGLGLWLGLALSLVPAGNNGIGHGMYTDGTQHTKFCVWISDVTSHLHYFKNSCFNRM